MKEFTVKPSPQTLPPASLMSKYQKQNIGKMQSGVTGIVPFNKNIGNRIRPG